MKQKIEQHTRLWADFIRSPSMRHGAGRPWLITLAVLDELNRHGGKDNGNLKMTYATAEFWLGTSDRTAISLAIRQAEGLKLISVRREPGFTNGKRSPNLFGIPWLPGANGGPPLHTWREITTDKQAKAILAALKKPRRRTTRYLNAELDGKLGTKWSETPCEPHINANSSKPQIAPSTKPTSPMGSTLDPTRGRH